MITGHEDPPRAARSRGLERLATAADTLVILMGAEGAAAHRAGSRETRPGPGDARRADPRRHNGGARDGRHDAGARLAAAPPGHPVHALASPALAVVGAVVGLRESLAWFEPDLTVAGGAWPHAAGEPAGGVSLLSG